ncbi:S-layer homology domain-containing protein [Psychrobacillus sp. FSL H8-0484]|uniref:S-layer homology domain-containing protein n=1 Tax=Psychrobacillus sp. FSL H8-0484 TaxID=2921390 RepID=UPI0030F758A1
MMKGNKSRQKLYRTALASTLATGTLVALVPISTNALEIEENAFSDVLKNKYYYEGVKSLTARGIISGYEDGTFRPGENISRAHAAKIMALALNLDTKNVKDPGFKDVSKNHPYYGYIAALVSAGIIKGYEDNTFQPKANLTRAHIAQILVLGFGLEEAKLSSLPFKDINDKQWFAKYIQTLYSNEITTGKTTTTFEPNAFVTRGQAATFIHRSELATQQKAVEIVDISKNELTLSVGTYALNSSLQNIFNESNLAVLKGAKIEYTIKDNEIVEISSIEVNASGNATSNILLDAKGSTFTGDFTVSGDYITLKNLTINGDLEIGSDLKNYFIGDTVTVVGKTIISDQLKARYTASLTPIAAPPSPTIIFINAKVGVVQLSKVDSIFDLRENSTVELINIDSNVQLKAAKNSRMPVVNIRTGATQVTINTNVGKLNVNSSSKLFINGSGSISEASVGSRSNVRFENTGNVDQLIILSNDVKVSLGTKTRIGDITLPADSQVKNIIEDYDKVKENIRKIGGVPNPDVKPITPPSTGDGGYVPGPTPQ